MKKKISLLLVLAMVLTILPVNMAVVNAATVSPSYLVADFEDGIVGNNDGNTFSLVDGPGASKYAVKVTDGNVVPTFDFCLLGSLSGATEYVNGTKVTSKRIYDVSAWIRADAAVSTNQVDFVFTMDSGSTTYTHTVSNAGLVKDQWVKVETTIEYSGAHTASIGVVSVKVAGGIAYTMDDLTLMCRQYKPVQEQATNPVYTSGLGSQTSIGTSLANAVNGWYSIGGTTTMTTAYNGTEVSLSGTSTEEIGGYTASITGTSGYAQIVCNSINIKYGTTYTVYFMAKADNDIAQTGYFYLIFDRAKRNDTENISDNNKYVYVTPSSVLPAGDDLHPTDEWRRYYATFKFDEHTYNTVLPTLSIGVRKNNSTSLDGHPSFSIANFRIYQSTGSEHTNLYPTGSMKVMDTGNNCYNITGSSSTTRGEVTNTITRVMAPYNGDHVIVKSMDAWENSFAFNLQSDASAGTNEFKMVINAKDKDDYFGSEATRVNAVTKSKISAIAEFDQTVWDPDMPKLTATVNYNAPSGSNSLLALCGMYDVNNKMVAHDVQEFSLVEGEGSMNLSMNTVAEAVTAKVFLWDAGTNAPVLGNVCELDKTTDANFIYVDPVNGKTNTAYGYNNPLKTVAQVTSALKRLKNSSPKDTYVILMPGLHQVTSTVSFDATNTSSSYKVVFTSYNKNDKGVISGGTDLTGKFTKYQGNIWRAPVPVGTQSRQLYVDDVKATVARSRDLVASEFVNTSTFDGVNLVTLGNLETSHSEHVAKLKEINANGRIDDVEFVFFSLWTNPRCQSASMTDNGDGSVTLTMDAGWKYLCNKGNSHAYTPKYYENALELLDEGNEWYLDSEGGYVYYWPRDGVNIGGDTKVTLATFDAYAQPFMSIMGTESSSVQNLTFDNLVFADVTWTRPSTTSGHSDAQNNHIREDGDKLAEGVIDVKYANNLHFTNNEFTRLGTTALRLLDGTKNTTVIGNEFYDLSSGAINVGNPNTGAAYRNPTAANLLEYISVENNYIHNVARDHWSAAAISAGYPANTNFSHNEICNIPYSGFHIGYGWGESTTSLVNLEITDNYIHDLFQGTIYDGGAIYTNGGTGATADNPNLITGNYITDIGPGAAFLYNDQGSTFYQVSDNVCDNSNIWGEYDVTTGVWKGPSGWMNVNLNDYTGHYNKWFNNYAVLSEKYVGGSAAADTTCRFDDAIMQDAVTGEWCDKALAIMANAGIQEEYKDNFENGLQKVNVIKELNLSVGESFSNVPHLTTSKRDTYKRNELTYMASSSNSSVASVSNGVITANATGTAVITYAVIENGVMHKGKTQVAVAPGVIEFENCHDNSLNVNKNLTGVASGNKYMHGYTTIAPEMSATVTIPKDGYYTVTYAVGQQLNEYVSPVTIKLDDTVLGTNDANYASDLYGTNTFSYQHAPMRKYVRTVWLEADTYNMTVDIGITRDNAYKYQFDYISIDLP